MCQQLQELDLLTLAVRKVTDAGLVAGLLGRLFCNRDYL